MITFPALTTFTELRLNTLCLNFERAYSNPEEDTIHDLRVSIRRLLSHLKYLEFIFEHVPPVADAYQVYYKKLKRCLKSLNELRDLQIQIQHLENIPLEKARPVKLLAVLKSHEKELISKLSFKMDLWNLQKIRHKLRRLILSNTISSKELELKSHLYLNFLTQEVHGAIQVCQKPDLVGCHRLRIRLKDYRYHLEMLEQGFGFKQLLIGAIKGWQDDLGALQDQRMLLEQLHKMDLQSDPEIHAFALRAQAELDAMLEVVKEEVHAIRFETQLK